MPDERHYRSLTRLAGALRAGEFTSTEATEGQLARIDALDDRLHSFVTTTAERALARAEWADAEMAAGRHRGPLHGVPIALKDLCSTRGVRTTAGTRVLRDFVPDEDATVVERLEAAGAVVLGKLAMTEGAFIEHHPEVTPPVNPWDPALWTGISSSGSGVATAAGLCFASLGTDTGGSIRFPSACNGLVGIKPTYGRVSRNGIFTLADSLDHVGPMTREVPDAAAVLGVIAGHDPRDPTSLRAPVPDYQTELGRDLGGVRIGVDRDFCTRDLDDAITGPVLETLEVFEAVGAWIRDVRFPESEEASARYLTLLAAEVARAHRDHFDGNESDYGAGLRAAIELGRKTSAAEYLEAAALRTRFAADLAELFEEVDLLLCPALGVALPAGANLGDPALGAKAAGAVRFTTPFDLSGSPTITLPCGFAGTQPIGLQLVGRHLDEQLLIRAGHAFERRTPWHRRHPDL